MTWRAGMNRARNARLESRRKSSRADPVAQAAPVTAAGVSSQVAPAVFSGGIKKKGRVTHVISKEELAPLVAQGLNDVKIGKLYGHSASWTQHLRSIYGIRPACGPGGFAIGAPRPVKPPAPPKIVAPPEPPPAPKPTREEMQEARYAAFFAAHGRYTSYSDRQISNYERVIELTRLNNRPTIDMAPKLYGDPAPDRPRA